MSDTQTNTEVSQETKGSPVETEQLLKSESVKSTTLPQMPTLAQIEKEYILRVLATVGNSKEKAAQVLGVSTKTVYNKLARYSANKA